MALCAVGDKKHQYILPSLDLGMSTTAIAIPVRFGKVFHVCIKLKSESYLRKVSYFSQTCKVLFAFFARLI